MIQTGGGGTLISAELKAIVGRLKEKEPELDAIVKRGRKRKRRTLDHLKKSRG
jgi:hypothetical protein